MISDTSPEIEAMQSRMHDAMSGEERLLLALQLSYIVRELAMAGIRDEHPDWTEQQIRNEFLRTLFPPGGKPPGL